LGFPSLTSNIEKAIFPPTVEVILWLSWTRWVNFHTHTPMSLCMCISRRDCTIFKNLRFCVGQNQWIGDSNFDQICALNHRVVDYDCSQKHYNIALNHSFAFVNCVTNGVYIIFYLFSDCERVFYAISPITYCLTVPILS
jgi:hypothetical protein